MPLAAPPPETIAGLSLDAVEALARNGAPPPVESWRPARCGVGGFRILADGRWLHEGATIARPEMVRLFSTILRREPDGGYALVTPAEMLSVEVDDAPFVAVELAAEGGGRDRRLAFRTNVGDVVLAGPDHPLRIEDRGGGPRPYLRVRGGLDAVVARPVFYELAELALADADGGRAGIWGGGTFFPLDP